MLRARKLTGGSLRALVVSMVVGVGTIAIAAPVASALPVNFWGIAPQAPPTLDQLQRIKRGGTGGIRIPVVWSAVEPTQGAVPDWTGVDPLVRGAALAGLDVLPFISGAPSWVVPSVPIRRSNVGAPRTLPVKTAAQRSAWTSFLRLVVARYGPGGAFWAENPDVPARPIRVWQIGNEVNFIFFVAKPSPSDYGKLVKISHAAIKGVDPGAKVLLSGLFALPNVKVSPGSIPAYKFLQQMYKSTPGVKRDFDGVSLHPYVRDYKYLTPEIEQVRGVLKKAGDGGVPLWITELGWSSGKPTHSDVFAKGPQGQVKQLKGAFSLLRKNQRKWHIQRVYWFSLDDAPNSCNFCDGSGLFGAGFIPKPAWYAFVKFTGGRAS